MKPLLFNPESRVLIFCFYGQQNSSIYQISFSRILVLFFG